MGNKKLKYIVIALVIIALLSSLAIKVYAQFIEYDGTTPSHPGLGVWWTGGDKGNAWTTFYNAQMKTSPPKYKSEASFKSAVNRNGNGAPKPDGSYETFWETCQKSKYIYWYGSYRVWTDGKFSYFPQTWYTQGNGTNQANWNSSLSGAKETFEKYKKWSSQWTGGKVVLICSYSFDREDEPEEKNIPLFFKAKSGTFTYDGSLKTVEGLHPDSDVSKLKAGHRYEAVAKRSEKDVGTYPVTFSKIVIYDKDNKDITNSGLYKITSESGQLKINDVPPPIVDDEDAKVEWRCVDHDDDSAEAYVFNETIGYHGFTPSGAGTLRSTYNSRYTPAGIFAMDNPPPRKYDSLSEWRNWKSTYRNGSDTITRELNLLGAGVSEVLSKYGGVYNVDRSLRKETYEIEHCQPQERYLETTTDSGRSIRINRESDWDYYMYEEIYIEYRDDWGRNDIEGTVVDYYYGRYPEDDEICVRSDRGGREWILLSDITYWEMTSEEWTPWEDVGGRIVWNNWGPYREYDEFNYQVLSVNCNKDGFDRAMRSYGDRDLSYANGDGGASLKTKETRGAGPGILGRGGHETARDSFYLDGDSCQVFACTADSFPGAYHDGKNNNNKKEYFNAEYKDRDPEFVNDEANVNYLVYFRDNEDNDVRADVWYPKATRLSDLISYPEEVAIGTLGRLFGGTPEIELTTIKPKWGGREFTDIGERGELWWRGEENSFIMKSQWASYERQPYELGLIWEYEADGINQVPAKVDGYDVKEISQPYYYPFEIACRFENSGNNKKALIPESPFVYGRIRDSQYDRFWNPGHAIRTLFVRSVSQ